MAKDNSKKDESSAELELIKSTLNSNLDESSVDIFSQDLFGPAKSPAQEPPSEPEKKPIEKPKPGPEKKAEPKKTEKAAPREPEERKKTEPSAREPELEEEKDVEELDLNIETGELKNLAASKEETKLDETEASLTQLEKMGGDLLSVAEIKKLFKNMNTMIDLLTLAMVRLDRLEKKLKDSKK